jgi:hypothetical protein
MRIAVAALAVLVIMLAARRATACPCCDPCSKYDDIMGKRIPVLDPEPLADAYVRVRVAPLPAHPRSRDVMAVLAGARFVPASPAPGVEPLHIIDGAHIPATIDHDDGAHVVIVHALALARGRFRIDIDGTAFAISPCRDDAKRATVCLEKVAP